MHLNSFMCLFRMLFKMENMFLENFVVVIQSAAHFNKLNEVTICVTHNPFRTKSENCLKKTKFDEVENYSA